MICCSFFLSMPFHSILLSCCTIIYYQCLHIAYAYPYADAFWIVIGWIVSQGWMGKKYVFHWFFIRKEFQWILISSMSTSKPVSLRSHNTWHEMKSTGIHVVIMIDHTVCMCIYIFQHTCSDICVVVLFNDCYPLSRCVKHYSTVGLESVIWNNTEVFSAA